jgi:hypothetical protein
MFPRPFKARNGALGGTHADGDRLLGKAGAGAGGKHFIGKRAVDFKGVMGVMGVAKAAPLGGLFEIGQGLVVVTHGLEFPISHFALPPIAAGRG